MKNIVNVNLKDATLGHSIGIEGGTDPIPEKNGFSKKKLTSGRTKTMSINTSNNYRINISKITQAEYDKLYKTWSQENQVQLTTERNEYHFGYIVDSRLSLVPQENTDGDIFYNGTIDFEEG